MVDLVELATTITGHLRENFQDSDAGFRQILVIAEEAGEAQEAYLAWSRGGPRQDVLDELADVLLTAHVTGVVLGVDLTGVDGPAAGGPFRTWAPAVESGATQWVPVMEVGVRAGALVGAYRRWSGMARRSGPREDVVSALVDVVRAAYAAADVLDVDLLAAVEAKAVKIFARGWRDVPAVAEVSR